MPKKICVIDGQGGWIGATVIKYIRDTFGGAMNLIAMGTNDTASAAMLKAGANLIATGENSICRTVNDADIIIGPVGITWPNAMMGEVTPDIAEAVMSNSAYKILLPFTQESVEIIGVVKEPLPHMVDKAVTLLKEVLKNV
ncbi:MAG: DUF3842 family protein [Desulfobacteraceae bacterium]